MTIKPLDSYSETLPALRAKRAELQIKANKLKTDCAIIRARLQESPSSGNQHENRVRELLGKPALTETLSDHDQLKANQRELDIIGASISTLDAEILKETRVANNKLVDANMQEIILRGSKMAKALVDVCAADLEYEQYLDSLEEAGATVGQFRIRLPGLGSPRDISSGYAYSLREFVDGGMLSKSSLPTALRGDEPSVVTRYIKKVLK